MFQLNGSLNCLNCRAVYVLPAWDRDDGTRHVTGRSKPLFCAAHTTVSFSVNELKGEDPLFSVKRCETGKELGRRISELEFVKMLICAKPVQNKQDSVLTLKCCKIKNTEEKPKGGGGIFCVYLCVLYILVQVVTHFLQLCNGRNHKRFSKASQLNLYPFILTAHVRPQLY